LVYSAKLINFEISCINNYMPNSHFKRGELYSVINGMASTAVARRLQKNFRQAGLEITIEQWSIFISFVETGLPYTAGALRAHL